MDQLLVLSVTMNRTNPSIAVLFVLLCSDVLKCDDAQIRNAASSGFSLNFLAPSWTTSIVSTGHLHKGAGSIEVTIGKLCLFVFRVSSGQKKRFARSPSKREGDEAY